MRGSIKKFRTFEEAEEDIIFQSPTLENLKRIYQIFEALSEFSKSKRDTRRGIIFYKSWEEALLDEDF